MGRMINAKIDERLIKMLLEKGYIFEVRPGIYKGLDRELNDELIIVR